MNVTTGHVGMISSLVLMKLGAVRLPDRLWWEPLGLGESRIRNQESGIDKNIGVVEQLIRPTGLVDPIISVRPTEGQIGDLINEILKRKKKKERVLVTTLTKRMAEDLTEYLKDEKTLNVQYLHSDVLTLERTDILDDLRKGTYDVLVGINLLREGLDLPEVSLVAILDADKEGFLRSETSLIQTMGRAARHVHGEVIMYADKVTGSMDRAIGEVDRRRTIQLEYNKKHGITPTSIQKSIKAKLVEEHEKEEAKESRYFETKKGEGEKVFQKGDDMLPEQRKRWIKKLETIMKEAASDLDFEYAARIRDEIRRLQRIP